MKVPIIVRTTNIEAQEKYAASHDRAADSLANQLSSETDPVMRERLALKLRRHKDQAEFCRKQAAQLRTEAGDDPAR